MGRKKQNVTKSPSESESDSNSKDSKEWDNKCAVCPSPAQSKCGGCQKVGYCSREHQKIHWKEGHKTECCCWKVGENKNIGRYLVAVRDIKQGEIILRESPLLITPPKITLPVCLGCYSEFRADGAETDDGKGVKPYACRKNCGWPMCKSAMCSNSREHEAECSMTKARGGVNIRHADTEHPLYQSIGILRALGLQEKNPDSFTKLMSLESNLEKRKEFHKKAKELEAQLEQQYPGAIDSSSSSSSASSSEVNPEVCVKIIREYFKREDASEDWILNLVGKIETNGHEIPIPDQDGHINRRIIGVYYSSSFMEHNCRPNCLKTWDLSTKDIIIRSAVPIKKGDHLSISYVDPIWGTNDRVNLLQMTKFFTCTCLRCKDPSELGTRISSLRCQHLKCMNAAATTGLPKEGMVTPTDPYNPDGDWKCGSCGEEYNASYATALVHKVGQEMEKLHENIGDISAAEDFLKRFSKNLSPNHFYLLEVKVELAQLYGRTSDEPLHLLPPKKLLRKIQLCEELLLVLNIITPGYNRLRALIIYELQAAVFSLSRLRRSVEEISLEKHLEELMQCGKWMSEVIKVLGWESINSIERKRAAGAERDLENLRDAVLSLQTQTSESTDQTQQKKEKLSPSSSSNIKGKISATSTDKSAKKGDKSPQPSTTTAEQRSHLSVDEESFIEEVF